MEKIIFQENELNKIKDIVDKNKKEWKTIV